MKKLFFLIFTSAILMSCETPTHKYKKVVSITQKEVTYQVTISKQNGGNSIERGAGGALIGGGADFLLGGNGKGGAIIGGLIGAATTEDATIESHSEMRTDTYYTITFSDSTKDVIKNHLYLSVGDSIIDL